MKIRQRPTGEQQHLQMTAMIDVVFLLLIFFLCTFQIVPSEGDFCIRLPQAHGKPIDREEPLANRNTFVVRLQSDMAGDLDSLTLDGRELRRPAGTAAAAYESLRNELMAILGDPGCPANSYADAEVEFICDYHLKYRYVIHGITAVSGKVEDGKVVKLIEKIKFTLPNR